jgi:hypothetical protein
LYCTAIHPFGNDLQLGMSLNLFVIFVFCVYQLNF